jgi:hypothetical protein
MTRFNLLPDPRFEALKDTLRERVQSAANALDHDTFPDVLDAAMRSVVHGGFAAAGAHEGTVWLGTRGADGAVDALVPVYNTGPNAAQFVGKFRQPIGKGLISTVYAYEQPFCENEVFRNQRQDPTLDRSLGVRTAAMIAVPLYFAGAARGVISCVQLIAAGSENETLPPGFSMEDLRQVQFAAEVLTRLLDHWLVGVTVAWRPE